MAATVIYGLVLGSIVAVGLLATWISCERAIRRHVERLEAEARQRDRERIQRALLGSRN
jgi:hypothetical protein